MKNKKKNKPKMPLDYRPLAPATPSIKRGQKWMFCSCSTEKIISRDPDPARYQREPLSTADPREKTSDILGRRELGVERRDREAERVEFSGGRGSSDQPQKEVPSMKLFTDDQIGKPVEQNSGMKRIGAWGQTE